MLQREHSVILLTFIKLPFVIKIGFFFLFLKARLRQVLLYEYESKMNAFKALYDQLIVYCFYLFCSRFYVLVNSYSHVEMVNSSIHTFSLDKLD